MKTKIDLSQSYSAVWAAGKRQRPFIFLAILAQLTVSVYGQSVTAHVGAGQVPVQMGVNPATNKIYVVNQNSANVTVINGATNATATVPVGQSPDAVAVNPETNRIYVANSPAYPAAGSVTVIDGSSDTVIATITVGTNPISLAVNPVTNKIYCANSSASTASVIDGATNTLSQTVTTGAAPQAVAVDLALNKIYVANSQSNNVTVIDGASNNTTTIAVGQGPYALAVDPVSSAVVVANAGSNSVTFINGNYGFVYATASVGWYPIAVVVNPATEMVYVANDLGNSVSMLSESGGPAFTLTGFSLPTSLTLNPITNKVYAANNYPASESVIDGSQVTSIAGGGTYPNYAAVNPITNKIYVSNYGSNDVTVIDGADYPAAFTTGSHVVSSPIFINPVTSKMYLTNPGGGDEIIVVSGEDGSEETVSTGGGICLVDFNPATNMVYVTSSGGGNEPPTLVVINGANDSPVATVYLPVGTGTIAPFPLVVNANQNKIYIGNPTNTSLTVIDGESNTVSATIPIGASPDLVGFNPVTNRIYVASKSGSGSLTIIDGGSNAVLTTLAIPIPQSMAINPLTNKIYISNVPSNGPGSVTVIDGAHSSIKSTVAVGQQPFDMAVNPVANKVYVSNYLDNTVSVIDGASDTATALVPVSNPHSLAVNPLTNKIFVANGYSEIAIIDGISNSASVMNKVSSIVSLAVNPAADQVAVMDATDAHGLTLFNEQSVNPLPLATAITPLHNNQTNIPNPSFTFTATSTTVAQPRAVFFQVDNWGGVWQKATGSNPTFQGTVSGLQPGFHTLYAYAVDGQEATAGQSDSVFIGNIQAYSFSVMPPLTTQSINFPALSSQTVGTPLTLQATASSGLAVSFSSSTSAVCAVSGVTATFAAAGTCTITASQSGNNIYSAAAPVTWSFAVNAKPMVAVVSVAPSSGTGATQTFSATYSDPAGISDLNAVAILFNTSVNGTHTCWVLYNPSTKGLTLENDAGTGVIGPIAPGASATLSNSQCSLSGAGSSVSSSGNNLTVNFALSFTTAYAGAKNVYLSAAGGSANTGFLHKGAWNTAAGPAAVSATPSSFSASYSDPIGITDLKTVQILFNSSVSGAHACWIFYAPSSKSLTLENDADTGTLGPIALGSSSTLSNSQCSIAGAGTSVNISGNNITVNFAVTFTSAFLGLKNVYLDAVGSSSSSGYIAKGSWTP